MRGDLVLFVPLYVAIGGLVTYAFSKLLTRHSRQWTGTFSAVWFLSGFVLLFFASESGLGEGGVSPFPILQVSYLGIITGLLATGIGALAAIASQGRIDSHGPVHLYYPLMLFALAGTTAVGFAHDLFTIFVAVELSSIPSYILIAYNYKLDPRALSAAIKYLIQGVAGTLTAIMGVALFYLLGHTLDIAELPRALSQSNPLLISLAAVFILLGYGVKLGIVPLHTWLPDAYVMAPAPITAILSGAIKAGVLIALVLSLSALPTQRAPNFVGLTISILALITMTAGNLLALPQKDLSRVLAYSSVAQMGYILLGFGLGFQYNLPLGITAGLFFIIAYGIMKAGAFLVADQFVTLAGSTQISRMQGVGAQSPVIGFAFLIFILGLIGIPFTSGFLGKLFVFQAGVSASTLGLLFALILMVNSAISLGYYVPILSTLLFRGGVQLPARSKSASLWVSLSVGALAIITLYLGIFPQNLLSWAAQGSVTLLQGGVP